MEGDPIYYFGEVTPPNGDLTLTVDNATGHATLTAAKTGDFTIRLSVGASSTSTGYALDNQVVQVHITEPIVQLPGGAGTSAAVVFRKGDNIQVRTSRGKLLFDEPLSSFSMLTIEGNENKPDTVTVDFAKGGSFVIPGGIVFEGRSGKGADALVLRGTAGADAFASAIGSATVNSLVVQFSDVEQLVLDGGRGDDTYRVINLGCKTAIRDNKGTDLLDFSVATAGVTVDLAKGLGQPQKVFASHGYRLALKGPFENVMGSEFADWIKGNSAGNRIEGRGGNDTLYGMAGHDELLGGAGNNVLLGGVGNDTLDAGGSSGRNLLIGGKGADSLKSDAGEDILIGGTTKYDNQPAALACVMESWASEGDYYQRCKSLMDGVRDPEHPKLGLIQLVKTTKTIARGTVFDDRAVDWLFGRDESDWIFAFGNDAWDTTPPAGYTIAPTDSLLNATEAAAAGFTFAGAEVGATYDYTVASSGGGTSVTGSGVISSATQEVTGIDVSSLPDGTLTYSVTLTDAAGNVGAPATATATLDATAPSGYTIMPDDTLINAAEAFVTGFTSAGAEVGATYTYTVISSGGGGTLTGTGTIASADQQVTGIDVSSLPDGILTYSVVLTDPVGNVGTAATATATLDKTAPTATITPNGTTVSTSPITFTIVFDESVTGVGVEDLFAMSMLFPVPLTLANFQAVSTTVYTVDVSGMSPGDVVYFALYSPASGISDTAGNALATSATAMVRFLG